MTVPQCGMGRGLTTDERAGTDTLSWVKHGWLFTGTSHWHRDGPTPAAAAGAVPTQTVGLGPCCPVAAGCYGASAAAVHSQSLRLGTWTWRCTTSTGNPSQPESRLCQSSTVICKKMGAHPIISESTDMCLQHMHAHNDKIQAYTYMIHADTYRYIRIPTQSLQKMSKYEA